MEVWIILCAVAVSALVGAVAVYFERSSKMRKLEHEISAKDLEINSLTNKLDVETNKLQVQYGTEIAGLKARLESAEESHRRIELEIREAGNKALEEVKKTHEETLSKQIDAIKAEMKAETEDLLKRRQEELTKKAGETYSELTKGLENDIKNMREAFEANKKTQNDTSSAMKEAIAGAIRNLEDSTKTIGNKADNLADALRGRNKMQGNWGETILQTLLDNEGFIEGVNYDKEATLRDASGKALRNEDSDSKMRPDYIIHFPDNNDVVIDAKVSLAAYADYVEATDDAARKEASLRNLKAIQEQVRNLSGKKYSDYLKKDHRMLDYVIMFVPNYPALQLAYSENKNIWQESFKENVLITTAETLMPFLRMINIAWRNTEQVRNQKEIIENASMMVKRVDDLLSHFRELGKKLDDARKSYEDCDKKLKDSGQSIVKSAQEVVRLGVPAPKRAARKKGAELTDVDLIEAPEEV